MLVLNGLFFLLPNTQCGQKRPRLEYADQNERKREKARVKQGSCDKRRKGLPYIHSAIGKAIDTPETVRAQELHAGAANQKVSRRCRDTDT